MVVHRRTIIKTRSPSARALQDKQNRPRVIPNKKVDKFAKDIGKIMKEGYEE